MVYMVTFRRPCGSCDVMYGHERLGAEMVARDLIRSGRIVLSVTDPMGRELKLV